MYDSSCSYYPRNNKKYHFFQAFVVPTRQFIFFINSSLEWLYFLYKICSHGENLAIISPPLVLSMYVDVDIEMEMLTIPLFQIYATKSF